MAGRGAPSFLKRQKEQKRAARAVAKRAAQQARRDDRAARAVSGDPVEDEFELLTGLEGETPDVAAGGAADEDESTAH
jgi:hypothetical protein